MFSNKFLILLSLMVSVLFTETINAQQPFTIYNSSNSPLPENSVRCIAIAPNGIKWIGTDYGLASFDDFTWTIYYTNNSGLPDNAIRSLAFDSAGTLWVGTFSNGLGKFDGINWTIYNTSNSDIPDDFVRSLAIDSSGNKWVGTIGGLGYFDNNSWQIYNMSNTSILSNNMSAIHIDVSDNSVAVGSINGGMALINNSIWTALNIWNSNLPDNSILGIEKDTAGTIWIATPASGLSAYIGGFAFLTLNTISSGIQSNSLTALSLNRNNDEMWIASNDEGLIRKSGLNFSSFNTSNSPMPDNFIQTVKVDAGGIVWIGTQTGGLVRLDPTLLTSIGDESLSYDMQIYPVPAKEILTLKLNGKIPVQVEVFDVKGKYYQLNTQKRGASIVFDVSILHTGNYFLKVNFEDGSYAVRKFLVTR